MSELLAASYPVLMPSSYDANLLADALPVMTRANPTLLAGETYYLAETTDGKIVGCGGWTRERPNSGDVLPGLGHIRHFATHPEWLGRGVGRTIYARCEDAARAAALRRFQCYASLNAEGFYKALGFRPLRRIKIAMAPGIGLPSMLMERSI